jgi:glutaredoxin
MVEKSYGILVYGGKSQHTGKACGIDTRRYCEEACQLIAQNPDILFTVFIATEQPDGPAFHFYKMTIKKHMQNELAAKISNAKFKMPYVFISDISHWHSGKEIEHMLFIFDKGKFTDLYIISHWKKLLLITAMWRDRSSVMKIHPVVFLKLIWKRYKKIFQKKEILPFAFPQKTPASL